MSSDNHDSPKFTAPEIVEGELSPAEGNPCQQQSDTLDLPSKVSPADQAGDQPSRDAEAADEEVLSQDDTLIGLAARMDAVQQSLDSLAQKVESLTKSQEIIQGGMRMLRNSVADAASSLGSPRLRELYLRLLLMYDLVEPPPAHLDAAAAEICRRIATQIDQVLAVNDFTRISIEDGVFDARVHKAVKLDPVDDPESDGRVLAIVQHGFRSPQGILRPASVILGRLREGLVPPVGTGGTEPADSSTDERRK